MKTLNSAIELHDGEKLVAKIILVEPRIEKPVIERGTSAEVSGCVPERMLEDQ